MFTIGAFAIVFDERGRVLLCHRRDMDAWNLPGGGVERGELPSETVIRETLEETGLEVVVERLVGVYGKAGKDEIVFAFLCRAAGGRLATSAETDECMYWAPGNLPANTFPKHIERIQDALAPPEQVIFRRQESPPAREWLRRLQGNVR
jgi:ADP-ribose pyrophosphatase YjhB (NUDIX family)